MPHTLRFAIRPPALVRLLVAIVIALTTLGALAQVVLTIVDHGLTARIARLASLDAEWALASWYATLTLLGCALLLLLAGAAARERGGPFVGHWRFLAIVFVYLALDEGVGIHELVTLPAKTLLGTSGWLPFAWVIPAGLATLVLALAYLPFLRALPRRTAVGFVVAGAIFVAGAIGMETVSGLLLAGRDMASVPYQLAAGLEEVLEMTGVVVFVHALLAHLAEHVNAVTVELR